MSSAVEKIDSTRIWEQTPDRETGTYDFSAPSLYEIIGKFGDRVYRSRHETLSNFITSKSNDGVPAGLGSLADEEPQNPVYEMVRNLPVEANKRPFQDRFVALQEWEGSVVEVYEDRFVARLTDMTDETNAQEEAVFYVDELRKDDVQLLREGAIFRWVVGYHYERGGTKRRSSQIVFRRLPVWTKSQLQRADTRAEEIRRDLGWV